MQKIILNKDVKVYCTAAVSFPEGIQEAFLILEKMLSKEGRTFYGICQKEQDGSLIYKAGVSENYEGEAEDYGFESFTIKSGEYVGETIYDWRKKIETISTIFQSLTKLPCTDASHGIEWYKNDKEMICMLKLNR